jgi:hypothetical protein
MIHTCTTPAIVTRDCRRESRRVFGGAEALTAGKPLAHRAERRAVARTLNGIARGFEDVDAVIGEGRRLTGWQIS